MKRLQFVLTGLIIITSIYGQTIEEIVKNYSEANSLDKLMNISTIKITGKMSAAGMEMPLVMLMKNPNKIKVVYNFNKQDIVSVFDGEKGYMINSMTGSTDPVELTGDGLEQISNNNVFKNQLIHYFNEGQLSLEGQENINNKTTFKLKANTGTKPVYFFIDKSSYMLIKTTNVVDQKGTTTNVDSYMTDYIDIDGIVFPKKTTAMANGMEAAVITFDKIEVNVPMDDNIFSFGNHKLTNKNTAIKEKLNETKQDNLNANKMSVNAYVKKFVERKILIWQEKGEFEKYIEYQKRVNDQTRTQQVQEFTNEAITQMKNQYAKSISWNSLSLSKYDAENETYLIQSSELGNFAIPVSLNDAPDFKQNFGKMKYCNPDFYINDNKLIFAKVDIVDASGKVYKYDSKQITTYSANNITYNFKPIEVNVKQDIISQNNTKIENISSAVGIADVDVNIPIINHINDRTFAVIIANENYQKEVKVNYAVNDGKIFKEYCEKTLGIPTKNIHFAQDASFGNIKSEIKWISDVSVAFSGQAKLIFYYAGHGMPNEADKSAYLLPIDGFSSDFETAIKLDDLYNRLTASSSQSVTVFLDACFSGSVRDNGMLANARGVKINPKTEVMKGNIIVFSAATGEETAYPYKEKQHGLFTYFLLKKLQETKGNVDYKSLSDYIIENVRQQSIVVNQKSQTPQVNTSTSVQNSWQMMKIN
jgi:hypothetical protein